MGKVITLAPFTTAATAETFELAWIPFQNIQRGSKVALQIFNVESTCLSADGNLTIGQYGTYEKRPGEPTDAELVRGLRKLAGKHRGEIGAIAVIRPGGWGTILCRRFETKNGPDRRPVRANATVVKLFATEEKNRRYYPVHLKSRDVAKLMQSDDEFVMWTEREIGELLPIQLDV